MKSIFTNIGLSVIVCQQIEALLGTILLIERRDRFHTDNVFINASAQVRTQVLESLKKELADLKVAYIQFAKLDEVIARRNWMVHRLVFDERFNAACEEDSPDDFLEDLVLFRTFYLMTHDAYQRRLAEVGGGGEWDPANNALLASFGDAIRKKADELRASRKKK